MVADDGTEVEGGAARGDSRRGARRVRRARACTAPRPRRSPASPGSRSRTSSGSSGRRRSSTWPASPAASARRSRSSSGRPRASGARRPCARSARPTAQLLESDRIYLRAQMQAYAACEDPEICAVVRNGFGDLVSYVERVSGVESRGARGLLRERDAAERPRLDGCSGRGLGPAARRGLQVRVNRSFFGLEVSDESQSNTCWWTFAITSIALFMVTLDNLVVTTALPVIRDDLHAGLAGLEWTVNAYTLTFAVLLLTGAALGDRFGRRRLFAIGLAIFTLASAAGGARAVDRRARRGARGPGPRRRDRDAADADDPLRRRAGRAARARARRLGRHQRPRRRARPARRRRGRPGHLVALDLLAERADRPRARAARAARACARRTARRRGSTCPASRSRAPACSGSSGGSSAATRVGWGSAEIVGALVAGVAVLGAFVWWELRTDAPDAADALLPQPDVRAREHRVPVHVLRDVRLDLPARAVLPDRAGLLAAAVRACGSCRGRRCRSSSRRSPARSPTGSAATR